MYIHVLLELKLWRGKEKSMHSLSPSSCWFLCRCTSFQWRYDSYYIVKINIIMQQCIVYLCQLSWVVWGSRDQISWSPTWATKSLSGYEKAACNINFNSCYFARFLDLLYFVKQNKIKSVLCKIKIVRTLHDESLLHLRNENLYLENWKGVVFMKWNFWTLQNENLYFVK